MLYWSDEESAHLFIELYVSVIARAAEQTGSFVEFFNITGQKPVMKTAEEMTEAAEKLKTAFADIEGYEGEYLRDMLLAVETLLALTKGEKIPYKEAVRRILGFEYKEVSKDRFERISNEVGRILEEDGYHQPTTGQKVKQWFEDNLLQPEELADTAKSVVGLLRRETHKIIPLPEEEGGGSFELTQGVSWAAFSDYQGHYVTNMLMNRESIWKHPNFIDTVAHELYPGHHTWYTRREQLFYEEQYPLEASVLGIGSAEDLLFEGMPESGVHFLGIDDPEVETVGLDSEMKHKITVARMIIQCTRILEINACYHYHVEGASREQVIDELISDGWMEREVAERVFRYFSHPFNSLYYPSYYYGRWILTYAYDRFAKEDRELFLRTAYDVPNSTGTFIRRIEELTGEPFDPVAMAQV
ncbi:MAG: DUF885 domain-containing protein [Lachnospiraceae bacterium]|nr:DUF885 domain-containing protein [Lachnospiraceae bacterium]